MKLKHTQLHIASLMVFGLFFTTSTVVDVISNSKPISRLVSRALKNSPLNLVSQNARLINGEKQVLGGSADKSVILEKQNKRKLK